MVLKMCLRKKKRNFLPLSPWLLARSALSPLQSRFHLLSPHGAVCYALPTWPTGQEKQKRRRLPHLSLCLTDQPAPRLKSPIGGPALSASSSTSNSCSSQTPPNGNHRPASDSFGIWHATHSIAPHKYRAPVAHRLHQTLAQATVSIRARNRRNPKHRCR